MQRVFRKPLKGIAVYSLGCTIILCVFFIRFFFYGKILQYTRLINPFPLRIKSLAMKNNKNKNNDNNIHMECENNNNNVPFYLKDTINLV